MACPRCGHPDVGEAIQAEKARREEEWRRGEPERLRQQEEARKLQEEQSRALAEGQRLFKQRMKEEDRAANLTMLFSALCAVLVFILLRPVIRVHVFGTRNWYDGESQGVSAILTIPCSVAAFFVIGFTISLIRKKGQ
jgi:hypothetical protein